MTSHVRPSTRGARAQRVGLAPALTAVLFFGLSDSKPLALRHSLWALGRTMDRPWGSVNRCRGPAVETPGPPRVWKGVRDAQHCAFYRGPTTTVHAAPWSIHG